MANFFWARTMSWIFVYRALFPWKKSICKRTSTGRRICKTEEKGWQVQLDKKWFIKGTYERSPSRVAWGVVYLHNPTSLKTCSEAGATWTDSSRIGGCHSLIFRANQGHCASRAYLTIVLKQKKAVGEGTALKKASGHRESSWKIVQDGISMVHTGT